MTCAELEILLADYMDGSLHAAEKSAFESHLAECAECAELARDAMAAVGFMERAAVVVLRDWAEPFTTLRMQKIYNLFMDPYERADITSNTYWDWMIRRDFFVFYATAMATKFLDTFKEFPPRHAPASFTIDHAVEQLHKFLAKD